MAKTSFLMIHNAWVTARGDRNDFIYLADYLKPFDSAMANLYAEKSGIEAEKITEYMDKETWFNGSEALELGFANSLLDEKIEEDTGAQTAMAAIRQIEAAMRQAGLSRSKTRALLQEVKGKPSAADDDMPSAVLKEAADIAASLTKLLRGTENV